MIDLRDPRADHRFDIFRNRHFALQNLPDELLDNVFAAFLSAGFLAEAPFFYDLVKQTYFGSLSRRGRLRYFALLPLRFSSWGLSFLSSPGNPNSVRSLFELFGVGDGIQLAIDPASHWFAGSHADRSAWLSNPKFPQGPHLACHLFGLEILQSLEVQVHLELSASESSLSLFSTANAT